MKFQLFKRAVKEVAEARGNAWLFDTTGTRGKVYSVVWRGKPAVLKVVGSADAMKEVVNTRLVQSLKRKAPPDIAPYLPEIYQADVVEHGGKTYGIIIMEPLSKAPGKTKEDLFSGLYSKDAARQSEVLGDAGFVSHIVHGEVDTGEDFKDLSEGDKEKLTAACTNAFLMKVEHLNDANNSNLVRSMVDYIVRQTGTTITKENLRSLVYGTFSEMARTPELPVSHGRPHLPGSEGEPVRKALNWLVSSGIAWDDLHDGNLLQRDGQLVLIDFGDYAAESEAGPELPKYAFDLFLSKLV